MTFGEGMADIGALARVEVGSWPRLHKAEPTRDIAELALSYRHDGVAGFDIAGPENGYPPSRFLESFQLLRRQSAYYTIHAGESAGCDYIWDAVQLCGANRIGHGVAIIEDIQQDGAGGAAFGDFAAYVLNEQIPPRCAHRLKCDRHGGLDREHRSTAWIGSASGDGQPRQQADERDDLTRSSHCSSRDSTTRSRRTPLGVNAAKSVFAPTQSAKRWLRGLRRRIAGHDGRDALNWKQIGSGACPLGFSA